MAIFNTPEASAAAQQPSNTPAVDIEAWTEQAVQALATVTISAASPIRGTSALEIPLDDHTHKPEASATPAKAAAAVRPGYPRREPLRRDSLKRREALLKGKEGSRRRQRWENDRLLSNPYAQPPLPGDWEVRPTYPVHAVPYFLAPLWDAEMEARSAARKTKGRQAVKRAGGKEEEAAAKVPKEIREKLKRARGAKGLLQDLEDEVRRFVERWEENQKTMDQDGMVEPDSEDEEIVFVGRNGQMSDMQSPRSSRELLPKDKLVFDSLADDHGASFGRWLVHSIGTYYGLRTWSVTTGNPARREAYVGIKDTRLRARPSIGSSLPRPLYCMV
ncbi:hypothetical protein H2201_000227 [Coniosporium apollinis]|uniref:R3H-associated N-terminal domain-containing protein n=1 Tax=Coniosporium apollinis TaxID=61459 RepID=A0ABQ9P5H6_9PEZI|nr:hypothetical protein H2201_000227 [Coniosporium apollinis]